MRMGIAAGIVVVLIVIGCPVKAMQAAFGPPPQHTDAFASAREATWGVALLRFTSGGELQDVALSGSGFFVSPRHFVTAAHVIDTSKLIRRARGPRDEIRVFRTDPFEDGFHGPLRIVFESEATDAAVLESTTSAPQWLRVSAVDPKEGEEVGLYGYPLATWSSKLAPAAYALGRVGVVAGFGRNGNVRRVVTTLVSNPGNSGGPVFRLATGEAIAIHKGQLLNPAGEVIEGYSISTLLSNLKPQLEKLGIPAPRR
jgi:S1-C subfamily serine protease